MFETGWWSFGLDGYRPCDHIYCLFEYESLPPLDMSLFDGEFSWLPRVDADSHYDRLSKMLDDIQVPEVMLPPGFIRFMREFQDRVPSCTACYFDLSEVIPSPFEPDAYLIRFLNDPQDRLSWYLYIKPDGDHFVAVSRHFIDVDINESDDHQTLQNAFRFCAPTFEAFIYRFWMENAIWFALKKGKNTPLTAAQQAYLDHYQSGKI